MFPRAELKQFARNRLRTNRLNPILVVLIATLLGGVVSGGGLNFNFDSDNHAAANVFPSVGDMAPGADAGILDNLLGIGAILVGVIVVVLLFACLVALAINIFFSNVVAVGLRGWFLRFMRGENASVGELFASFRIYRPVMVTKLLTGVYTFLWSLLFVIPGIVKGYAYSMADYIIYENPNLSADRAIQMSCQMTRGHKGDLFVLDLSWLGWQILSGITLGILGIVYVNPYMYAAHAAAYEYLKAQAINDGTLTWEDFGQVPPVFEPPVTAEPVTDIYPTDPI